MGEYLLAVRTLCEWRIEHVVGFKNISEVMMILRKGYYLAVDDFL